MIFKKKELMKEIGKIANRDFSKALFERVVGYRITLYDFRKIIKKAKPLLTLLENEWIKSAILNFTPFVIEKT